MTAATTETGSWQTHSDLRHTDRGTVGSEGWVTVSTVRELLRCNTCQARGRRTLLQRVESTTYYTDYLPPKTHSVTRFIEADGLCRHYPAARCGECGSADLRVNVVAGRLVRNKPCDGRCMGATGPRCECECGGQNHGGKYTEWG